MATLPRPRLLPNGTVITEDIPACKCDPLDRRGPPGGCCGLCGYAIPDEREAAMLAIQRESR